MNISREEYARFISAVNTNYSWFRNIDYPYIAIDDKIYLFRNYGFGEYEIIWVGENK